MSDKLMRMLTRVKEEAQAIKTDCDSICSGTKLDEYDDVYMLETYLESIINSAEAAKKTVMSMYDELN